MSVEVERKFLFTSDTLKTLEQVGVCIGQREFHDQYFDTPQFDLTLRDMWLRKREGCWELKCATADVDDCKQPVKATSLCTRYKEITSLPDIQTKLREVIEEDNDLTTHLENIETGHKNVPAEDETWLGALNLICFSEFTTLRRSFTVAEEGVQIDLDQADFGYNVGEIEVLLSEGEDVAAAVGKIEKTAQILGLSGDQRIEGKMNVFLKRYHPEHYEKLLNAHIL
ncbi:thiamine-triphosphatase [Synchiropus splendidus]|uniref:thiamine-triphosphatase n=1 Tax=Synchiropus splendidus TaxID=270530 RepID=UPI00237E4305|nr:thiamine-triphosphatase [Synchiropus splendidus]XP_053714986.1 thiamine-triphosphatase [Synchiropus splendidus]XP_053714987.1 thiamine-triphosphatase [Synchiropus splendidus]